MNETPSVYSTNGPSLASITIQSTTPDKSEEQSSEIQCICGFHDDDGYTICCDQCDTWQHLYCVDIKSDSVPDTYLCPNCLPRPLDVRKAKEHQQNRRERKEKDKAKTRNRKKPSSNSNSSKKKDHSNGNTNGTAQSNGPGPPTSDKSTGSGKPSSPRDGHQGNRKRGSYRPSISNASNSHVHGDVYHLENSSANVLAGVPIPGPIPNGLDIESDTDLDKSKKYRYEFTDITDTPHLYVNGEVESFVNSIPSHQDDSIQHFTREDFNSLSLPKLAVHETPDPTTVYSPVQPYLTIDSPCLKGQLVALCKGDVGFQRDYKAEAIYQYFIWRHPKPFVFFHPSQQIYIDSRIRGTTARFVRRSCQPNLLLRTIVIDNSEVLFGLFAAETLAPKTSLTIEWEWNGSAAIERLRQGMDPDHLSPEESQEALSWAQYLAENFGDCACQSISNCLFAKLKVKRDSVFAKPYSLNGKETTNHILSELPQTPEQDGFNSKRKSRSRDLSPSAAYHHEVSDVEMSNREARKMRNLVSRIEKLEQEEQPQGNKRRKKNSVNTQIVTSGLPPPSPADWKDSAKVSENGSKNKNASVITSPPYTPQPLEGIGEHVSSPMLGSDARSLTSEDARISPQSPANADSTVGKLKPPITVIRRPAYVDVSTQTDPSEGSWWLIQPKQDLPMRPAQLSLKKRLMRDLLREKREEENNRMAECKKRKLELETGAPVNMNKGRKLSLEDDVQMTRDSSGPFPPRTSSVETSSWQLEQSGRTADSINSEIIMQPNTTAIPNAKLVNGERIHAQLFAINYDEPITPVCAAGLHTQLHNASIGHRRVELSVQLPPSTAFLSAITNTCSSPIPIPQAQLHSPSTISCTSILSPSTPSARPTTSLSSQSGPPKTKKLSLSEYGNRRKKVDAHERDKSTSNSNKMSVTMAPVHEGQKTTRNGNNDQLAAPEATSALYDTSC